MLTALMLLRIIKTAEWSRYTGASSEEQGYAYAGTTGDDAIELRCPIPLSATDPPQFIHYRHVYRHVESDDWYLTGYSAVMSYDTTRKHEPDGDGYEFVPYYVTQLQLYTHTP